MEEKIVNCEFGDLEFNRLIMEDDREVRVICSVDDNVDKSVIKIGRTLSYATTNWVIVTQSKNCVFTTAIAGFERFATEFKVDFKNGGHNGRITATSSYGLMQKIRAGESLNKYDGAVINVSDTKNAVVNFAVCYFRVVKEVRRDFKLVFVDLLTGAGIDSDDGAGALILDTARDRDGDVHVTRAFYSVEDLAYIKLFGLDLGYGHEIDVVIDLPDNCSILANLLLDKIGVIDELELTP